MRLLVMLVFLMTGGIAVAKPSNYDSVKRAKLVEWVEQLRVKANEATVNAKESQRQLQLVGEETVRLNASIATWTAWGLDQQDRAWKAETRNVKLAQENKFMRNVISYTMATILAAASLLLILRYGGLALNTVAGAAIAFGAPVVVFFAVRVAVSLLL